MTKTPWALILGASSGFGEATALELARTGMNIFGVHLDRRGPHVEQIREKIDALGRESEFFYANAADPGKRGQIVETMSVRLTAAPAGTLRVLLHSLNSGSLLPLAGAEQLASRPQIEAT